jgi:hypothetical protein
MCKLISIAAIAVAALFALPAMDASQPQRAALPGEVAAQVSPRRVWRLAGEFHLRLLAAGWRRLEAAGQLPPVAAKKGGGQVAGNHWGEADPLPTPVRR